MVNKPDHLQTINLSSWKAEPDDKSTLRKAYIADEVKAVEGESRTLQFTISTDTPDRDRDTIDVAGDVTTRVELAVPPEGIEEED